MYVIRLSCELPYAVGVRNRHNLLHAIRESKAKFRTGLDRLYDDRLDGSIEPGFLFAKVPRVLTDIEATCRSDCRIAVTKTTWILSAFFLILLFVPVYKTGRPRVP